MACKGKTALLVAGLTLLFLGIIGLIISAVIYVISSNVPYMYAVVVDAGSTGSRLNLYRWLDKPFRTNGEVEQLGSQDIEPGISSYLKDPQQAFTGLNNSLRILVKDLTAEEKRRTPIYLAATAGMRLAFVEDPVSSFELFEALRRGFATTGLDVESPNERIRLLSGAEEGLFGWVSVNKIAKLIGEGLHEPPLSTMGSLDLGGASTQISFVSDRKPMTPEQEAYNYPLSLFGNKYDVYSYSFLCYGKSVMQNRVFSKIFSSSNPHQSPVSNPCYLKGYQKTVTPSSLYSSPCIQGSFAVRTFGEEIKPPAKVTNGSFTGTGNFDECQKIIEQQFNRTCHKPPCSFNDVYQPSPRGQFMAYSGFAYTMNFILGSDSKGLTKAQIEKKVREYCSKTWEQVTKTVPQKLWKYAAGYCFDGIYVLSLLSHYGFKTDQDWKNINFALKINGASVSWALGYILEQTGHLPSESPKVSFGTTAFALVVTLFIILIIIGIVLMALSCRKSKKQSSTDSLFNSSESN